MTGDIHKDFKKREENIFVNILIEILFKMLTRKKMKISTNQIKTQTL